jgi:anti-sigma regulatory factor (Ser/Thr protein kinase)
VGSFLIDAWLGDELDRAIRILDQASASELREEVRRVGREVGLVGTPLEELVTAASELGHNQLRHAREGVVLVRAIERSAVPGVELVAADCGPGVVEPRRALHGKPNGGDGVSLGVGLSSVLRLSDEVDVDVRVRQGSCVRARKFAASVRRSREVGIYGVPCAGESTSGDHAAFVRSEHGLLLALADGLGHGPEAYQAAGLALDGLRSYVDRSLEQLVEDRHAALVGTRGAALAVVRLDDEAGDCEHFGVGNVAVGLESFRSSRKLTGRSGIVGGTTIARTRGRLERAELRPNEVVWLASDGVSSRASIALERDLLHDHPIVVAEAIANLHGRDHDDVTVLVAR